MLVDPGTDVEPILLCGTWFPETLSVTSGIRDRPQHGYIRGGIAYHALECIQRTRWKQCVIVHQQEPLAAGPGSPPVHAARKTEVGPADQALHPRMGFAPGPGPGS